MIGKILFGVGVIMMIIMFFGALIKLTISAYESNEWGYFFLLISVLLMFIGGIMIGISELI